MKIDTFKFCRDNRHCRKTAEEGNRDGTDKDEGLRQKNQPNFRRNRNQIYR